MRVCECVCLCECVSVSVRRFLLAGMTGTEHVGVYYDKEFDMQRTVHRDISL